MEKEKVQNDIIDKLISIIIPVYKVEAYIDRCIKSVIQQTYRNIEIILVDDGSPDKCGSICEYYSQRDKRILVFHKTNAGLSDARNYGIEKANGEYIVFIDSDDYVDADYIAYLYNLILKYKTRMSICQHRTLYDNGSIKDQNTETDEVLDTNICLERMLYHDRIDTAAWAKMYHRDLFRKVLYPKGRIFEDIGTTYALMLQCRKIAVGYASKYNYVFHNNSIVNGQFTIKKLDMIDMTDKMASDVIEIFPALENAVIRRRVYARFSTLNQMLNEKERYNDIRVGIIGFIMNNGKLVLKNKKAPKRDKMAIILLRINYKLYKWIWLKYQNYIMGVNNQNDTGGSV